MINISGRLSLSPVVIALHIDFEQAPISIYSPYLGSLAKLTLSDGLFSLNGDLDVDLTDEEPHIVFTGKSTLNNINFLDNQNKKNILSWKNITGSGIYFSSVDGVLRISKVDIDELNSQIVFDQKSQLNLQTVLIQGVDQANEQQNGKPLSIHIDVIALSDNHAQFSDLSLIEPFYSSIDHINGQILNYSTEPNTVLKVEGRQCQQEWLF